jgi:hypothetical protein
MEVSDQLHSPVTLSLQKKHTVSIGQETGWAPEPVWTLQKKKYLPLLEIQPIASH